MRALCGAIITAGAMIALGLTALGIGQRYSSEPAFQRPVRAADTTEPGKAEPGKSEPGKSAPGKAEPGKDSDQDIKPFLVKLSWMDRPLVFCLVFTTCVALIGLGIAIAGLAYHHVRRDREYLVHRERVVVPPATTS